MPTALRKAELACGAVLRGGGRWWVVAQVAPTGVLMCPLVCTPRHRHRADMCIGWAQALLLGCPAQAVLRCRPVWRGHVAGLLCVGRLKPPACQRMVATLVRELHHHQHETGRPFIARGRAGRCGSSFVQHGWISPHAPQDNSTRAGRIRAISFGPNGAPQKAQHKTRNAAGYLHPHHAGG
ncbi:MULTISPECIES: hypothetical protein [Acetobacter]|uniref:Uncharacterized protein n=2 Tax=Acetobacter TaxID=434 RepID=A0AAN1PIP9_9PROT|nr:MULTISPECIES: hypothetical protein [Acetobacter]ASL39533.1 hypothetical protein CBI36_03095 [Acetobacter oryzifermentans]AXN01038.1 hypothetical protein CJF59_11105 [Acetobacter pomorum]KAA8392313.1 hypothetical protein FKW19_14930 [Acetobacter sp. DmW_125128]KAA8398662.1 hypothetical protein FKW20_06840 [Acetobacter sp. DmW_125127]KAA8402682.1 hypothetical protein FKW15_11910 [Acetobacter sp. DmW_125133]